MIDLVGYRRYGHNEGDEPTFTQPVMYARIQDHPSVRALWADKLIERGLVTHDEADQLVRDGMQQFQAVYEKLKAEEALIEEHPESPPPHAAQRVKSAVDLQHLRDLNESLLTLPDNFNLHRKLTRAMQQRHEAFADVDANSIEWATAEELALATIVQDGIAIRFTGEDVARGTFSQRHAVFFDTETNEPFTPLQSIPQASASFEIHNSPLTENSTIGFEFGYNVQAPDRLVIWEAQYGDFVNVAQPMIDEFIVAARAKWGQTPSLVLLLPHGNEGQGPDHSSARIERFLNLAAETNLRIAFPTTAAQYFHVLRRQALLLKTDPLPLILFTPKGLLRHPLTASRPRDLAEGSWRAVLDDPDRASTADRVRRVLLCSGRIFVDLFGSDRRAASEDVALVRVEQLYPFPHEPLHEVLNRYSNLEQVLWVQEEPRNMGAWEFVRGPLTEVIEGRWPLTYIGRPPSSSPAEGSATWYASTQQALIERAYDLQVEETAGVILERQ
jgi:2-oxoglutarate dehydrogenase E1 component